MKESIEQQWIELAEQLQDFASSRFINRVDVCGTYVKKETEPDAPFSGFTGSNLKPCDILSHFHGEIHENNGFLTTCIGAHTIDGTNFCKWIAFDVDRHDDRVTVEGNWQIVQSLLRSVESMGLKAVVEDSNGDGGFHIWIFLFPSMPSTDAHALAAKIREDAGVYCEIYPKQAFLDPGQKGNWLRLPGKHPNREHWSKFWDGNAWVGPQALLDAPVNSPPQIDTATLTAFSPPSTGEHAASGTSPDFEDTISALAAIPNNDESWRKVGRDSRWDLWFLVLGALSLYGEAGHDAALAWSMQNDCHDDDTFEKKWASLLRKQPSRAVTGRTIIDIAQKHFNWEAPIRLRLPDSPAAETPKKAKWATTQEELKQVHKDKIEKINKTYAIVKLPGKTKILREKYNAETRREEMEYIDPTDLRLDLADETIQISLPDPKTGKPDFKPIAPWWITHKKRRQYEGVAFLPAGEITNGHLNLWKGWGVTPKEGDCSIFLDHLQRVICSGNEDHANYLVNWMADAVQNPAERPGICVVFRGQQGAGKGMVLSYFSPIFGSHYKSVTNPAHLSGKFNAHLASTLLLFADEAFNVRNKQAEGTLKALITEPEFMMEQKGIDATEKRNMLRIIMSSNNDWVVPADGGDRRFFVLDVSNQMVGKYDYFQGLVRERDNGGIEAFFHYLLQRDLSKVNLRAVPKTKALIDQKIHSLGSVEAFWYGRLQEGILLPEHEGWLSWVRTSHLWEFYQKDCGKSFQDDLVGTEAFSKRLRKICPSIIKAQKSETANQGRRQGYKLPSLSRAREAFSKYMNAEIQWDDDAQDFSYDTEDGVDIQDWKSFT
jgi:hypothetical protein